MQYGTFKKYVAEIVVETLTEIQSKYQEILDSNILEEVFTQGAIKARKTANKKLKLVQETMGLEIL